MLQEKNEKKKKTQMNRNTNKKNYTHYIYYNIKCYITINIKFK